VLDIRLVARIMLRWLEPLAGAAKSTDRP